MIAKLKKKQEEVGDQEVVETEEDKEDYVWGVNMEEVKEIDRLLDKDSIVQYHSI